MEIQEIRTTPTPKMKIMAGALSPGNQIFVGPPSTAEKKIFDRLAIKQATPSRIPIRQSSLESTEKEFGNIVFSNC